MSGAKSENSWPFLHKNTMTTEIDAYIGLGADINKPLGDKTAQETKQGVVSQKLPELSLDMTDEDIVKLTAKWEKTWQDSPTRSDWETKTKDNENYWLGKQFEGIKGDKQRPNVDNLIFESLETYLPQMTRRNPEPLVSLARTEFDDEGNADEVKTKYVTKVKGRLGDLADSNKIRLKLKRAGRHWAIYLIGAVKHGWDLDKDCPTSRVIRAKKLILDPEAWIDEDGYTGEYVGERRKLKASKILKIIGEGEGTEKARKAVEEMVKDETGTDIQFIEWNTAEYMCWTLNKEVLLKRKNPHWNYDRNETEESVDTYGNATPTEKEVKGINHFPSPRIPYSFLVVFNLGDQPMDKTSFITQNLSNQDRINKRNKQIDKNADSMNDGMVVSLERSGLSESQAKRVSQALRNGGVVAIPSGNPQEAVYRPAIPGLPADVYNDLVDTRNRLRDIFGTRGSSPAGIGQEKTVRGKFMVQHLDTDRIGGGVSEYLEQFADDIYNWWVQLLYVYDDGFQFVEGAKPPKIIVSVKEGSLLPQDSTTLANQAIELAIAGKMATVDMYKRLEFPNPEEMAANVWLETNAPQILYGNDPRIAQAMQIQAEAKQAEAQAEAQTKVVEAEIKQNNAIELEKVKQTGKIAEKSLPPVPEMNGGG
jgi:hypothetical protein